MKKFKEMLVPTTPHVDGDEDIGEIPVDDEGDPR